MYSCAHCGVKTCKTEDENYPNNCPTLESEKLEEIKNSYDDIDKKIAYNAALTEKEGYGKLTRVEETVMFLKKMNVKNVGLSFCSGLFEEGNTLSKILKSHGFVVNSVMCKTGSIPKDFIGINKEERLRPETNEIMCNPIGQAEFLNQQNCEYNILLGLCVGHDSLFLKYSKAPVTVIGVKDRVLCNNPIGVLYQADKYYKDKLFGKED